MPDQKEGRTTAFSGEEPRDESMRREPANHLRDELSLDNVKENGPTYAGETTDVISDYSQEQTEDGTAAEEEYSVRHDHKTESSVKTSLEPMHGNNLTAEHVSENPVLDESSVYESGESLDAVQDSAQAGQDGMARRAGESSRDRESNDYPGNRSEHQA